LAYYWHLFLYKLTAQNITQHIAQLLHSTTVYCIQELKHTTFIIKILRICGEIMGVEVIFKIAAIGILTAIVGQVLKHSGKDEIATMATLAGVIIVLLMVLDLIVNLFDAIKTMFNF